MSTILLVLIYVVVSVPRPRRIAGTIFLKHHGNDVLSALGGPVLGSPLDKILIIAVLTSASASTQTTILPTARTTLSMARFGAIPKIFGRIHPRYLTPDVSTLAMGAVSLVWTLVIINASQNVLSDSITGIGFGIAFYYGLTGFACVVFYRKELFKSVKNFIMVGVAPFFGGAMLTFIFVKAFLDYKTTSTDVNYSGGIPGSGISGRDRRRVAAPRRRRDWCSPTSPTRSSSSASGKRPHPGVLEGTVKGEASVMSD